MAFTSLRLFLRQSAIILKSGGCISRSEYKESCFAANCKIYRHSHTGTIDPAEPANQPDEFHPVGEMPYQPVDFVKIAGGDPEKTIMLELIQLELCNMHHEGEPVPTKLEEKNWIKLLSLPSIKSRQSYLSYLWTKETTRRNIKSLQEMKNETRLARVKAPQFVATTSSPIVYGLNDNSLFRRFQRTLINRFYDYRLLKAMTFNPQIMIDCSYEPYMKRAELGICCKLIVGMWAENRLHHHPYHIVFCNMDPQGFLMERLRSLIPTLDKPDFPFHHTAESYLDLHDRARLVYLTPYAKNTLNRYNADDIYIIGAMSSKYYHEHVSLMKAKKYGLRTASLPINKHVTWTVTSHILSFRKCLAVMNDFKDGGDWKYAFRHLRKTRSEEIESVFDEDER